MSTFKTKKQLGQNFLNDSFVIEAIADAAAGAGDTVLEIGPGLGVVTEQLAQRAEKVWAVEIDDDLIPILRTRLFAHKNVEIIHSDIIKTDINKILEGAPNSRKIVGNLPYYITTPILMKLIEDNVNCDAIVVMVQKEVAQKIMAAPGSSDYGVLGSILQYYCSVETVIEAPSECFDPRPKVDSEVIKLTPKRSFADSEKYTAFVKACFTQRRKTAANGLAGYKGLTKEDVSAALASLGHPASLRAETLSPEQFEELRKELFD